jgi:hypothetical protein
VQPSLAQVRVSPKARTTGPAPAARRLPLRIGTAMLGLFSNQAGKLSRASPNPAGRGRCGRVGSGDACWVLLSCGAGRYGWGWAWPEGLGPPGLTRGRLPGRPPRSQRPEVPASLMSAQRWLDRAGGRGGTRPASPNQRAEPARSTAVDAGPGGRLAVTELLARVGDSSVTANCPCADQGGRHVDMVVGADHRGRACVGVWRDAASGPLTALRQRPGHGRRSCWTRPTAWRRGWVQASGRSHHPALPGPPGVGTQPGLGPGVARPPRAVRCWKAASFGLAERCLVRVWAARRCRTWDR